MSIRLCFGSIFDSRLLLDGEQHGDFIAVREVHAVDALAPYLVRQFALVDFREPEAPEELDLVGEDKRFLDPKFDRHADEGLDEHPAESLSHESGLDRHRPYLGL